MRFRIPIFFPSGNSLGSSMPKSYTIPVGGINLS